MLVQACAGEARGFQRTNVKNVNVAIGASASISILASWICFYICVNRGAGTARLRRNDKGLLRHVPSWNMTRST